MSQHVAFYEVLQHGQVTLAQPTGDLDKSFTFTPPANTATDNRPFDTVVPELVEGQGRRTTTDGWRSASNIPSFQPSARRASTVWGDRAVPGARAGQHAQLPADRGERARGRGDLRAAGWPAAGDRAGRRTYEAAFATYATRTAE